MDEESAKRLIKACIVMHNYSIATGDLVAYQQSFEYDEGELERSRRQYRQTGNSSEYEGPRSHLYDYIANVQQTE